MKFIFSLVALIFFSGLAHADFNSSIQILKQVLESPEVQKELADEGELWTVHKISSGEHFGYQIVTQKGCKLNALYVHGDLVAYPKVCQ